MSPAFACAYCSQAPALILWSRHTRATSHSFFTAICQLPLQHSRSVRESGGHLYKFLGKFKWLRQGISDTCVNRCISRAGTSIYLILLIFSGRWRGGRRSSCPQIPLHRSHSGGTMLAKERAGRRSWTLLGTPPGTARVAWTESKLLIFKGKLVAPVGLPVALPLDL